MTVERLSCVDDAGRVVNPHALEAQLHGSVAHGIGEALLESVIFEQGSGQLLSGSFRLCDAARRCDTDGNSLGAGAGADQDQSPRRQRRERGQQCRHAGAIINAVIAAWGQRDSCCRRRRKTFGVRSKRGVLKAAAQE